MDLYHRNGHMWAVKLAYLDLIAAVDRALLSGEWDKTSVIDPRDTLAELRIELYNKPGPSDAVVYHAARLADMVIAATMLGHIKSDEPIRVVRDTIIEVTDSTRSSPYTDQAWGALKVATSLDPKLGRELAVRLSDLIIA